MVRKIFFLLSILTVAGALLYAQEGKRAAKITGFLVDVHCATGLDERDRQHPVSCALQPSCAASGYAVVAKDTLFKLDDTGNKLALEILKNTKPKKGLAVVITGTLNDNILYVDAMSEVL